MQVRPLLWLLLLALVGCTSPNPVLYTLAVVPGPVLAGAPHSIQVRRIGLAGYLDRPGIVRSSADYKLQIANDDRWGEPLGGLLLRVLDQDLSQRLPASTVYADSGAISADPDLIVEIDLQRFDADSAGVILLSAEVSVRPGGRTDRAQTRTIRLQVTPNSTTTAEYVAALSKALAQMADIIANMAASKSSGITPTRQAISALP
jgi:uncharacterized lipoprotein YmbA